LYLHTVIVVESAGKTQDIGTLWSCRPVVQMQCSLHVVYLNILGLHCVSKKHQRHFQL